MDPKLSLLKRLSTDKSKKLVFVRSGFDDFKADGAWNLLMGGGKAKSESLEGFDDKEINLHDSLRGYLTENNIECRNYANISPKSLFVVNQDEGEKWISDFVGKVSRYRKIEEGSYSHEEGEILLKFKNKLRRLTAKYKQ